jgi:hypothetical protein
MNSIAWNLMHLHQGLCLSADATNTANILILWASPVCSHSFGGFLQNKITEKSRSSPENK